MDETQNQGIGHFKIDYEIQGQDSRWSAGIIAYSSEEAVKSLAKFLRDTISDFKGFKIDTLSYQGAVHHLSDEVRAKIIEGAQVTTKAELQEDVKDENPKDEKPQKKGKKSILKK